MSPFPEIPEDDAAEFCVRCAAIIARMADRGVYEKAPSRPLPSGVLTCGEASIMIPAFWALIAHVYPRLADPETLDEALQRARTAHAGGAIN
jgi:hypothetical protein